MKAFLLEIITPTRQVYKDQVKAVSVPTPGGIIQILAKHQAIFSSLTEGEIKIDTGHQEIFLAIGGGFIEVTGKSVLILVSRAAHATELNEAEISKAYQTAKDALAQKKPGVGTASMQSVLRQSLVELKVLRRLQKRKRSPNPLN